MVAAVTKRSLVRRALLLAVEGLVIGAVFTSALAQLVGWLWAIVVWLWVLTIAFVGALWWLRE
jgi:hypothetical protein